MSLEGFELIVSKRVYDIKDSITITKDGVFFNKTLKERLKSKHVGFYFNAKDKKIAIHISPVNQTGYFSGTAVQFKNKDVMKMFKALGWGVLHRDVITKLNYIDENTILIGLRYPEDETK